MVVLLSSYQSDNTARIACAVRADRIDAVYTRTPNPHPCVEILFRGGGQQLIPVRDDGEAIRLVEVIEQHMRAL